MLKPSGDICRCIRNGHQQMAPAFSWPGYKKQAKKYRISCAMCTLVRTNMTNLYCFFLCIMLFPCY